MSYGHRVKSNKIFLKIQVVSNVEENFRAFDDDEERVKHAPSVPTDLHFIHFKLLLRVVLHGEGVLSLYTRCATRLIAVSKSRKRGVKYGNEMKWFELQPH